MAVVPTFDDLGTVRINAWTGEQAAASPMSSSRDDWAVTQTMLPEGLAMLPSPPKPENWRDERIGWGLVLPDRENFTPEQLASAADAPEPLRALLADRPASKVLRYRPGNRFSDWVLRDYANGGDRPIATSPVGAGPQDIPAYLLIAATPAQVPWSVQYQLNLVRRVGRLDLSPDGLANYVAALIDGWKDSAAQYSSPLVWAVDHGGGDITSLMRDAVAAPVYGVLAADPDMTGARFIDGRAGEATSAALLQGLHDQRPSLVVTTSHGQTGPLDQVEVMREQLGLLVDANHELVDPAAMLGAWQPDGAVWLAQACCSAGSREPSLYQGLFDGTSLVGSVLDGVARLGACVSPLPQALLGASRPLRAFIGHVEPTFDWTMAFPPTRQQLTDWVQQALYNGVCAGLPVGLALENAKLYQPVGALLFRHSTAVERYAVAERAERRPALDLALYSKVTAYDRASTVILGDPTAAIALPSA